MKFVILHESMHRIRFRVPKVRMSMHEADLLECYLQTLPYVQKASVSERACTASVVMDRVEERKAQLMEDLRRYCEEDEAVQALVPEETGRALNRQYQEKIASMVLFRILRKLFLPYPLQMAWTVWKSLRYSKEAIGSLLSGRLDVSVLDATAITASMLRGDFDTASSVIFLLEAGDTLEEWTHRKSVGDLARSMSLNVERVWKRVEGEEDVLTEVRDIKAGDCIVVRTSHIIPFDGSIREGEVSINQSSMTGESIPVHKGPGGLVYAGTVVEEGECIIEVSKTAGFGKYDQIVKMIEESEKLKSETESKAYHLADRLVPYSLGGSLLTWLITRNAAKALSFLMVDFSCALKLSMPLSVLSAIREAGNSHISVKGGRFLEAVAEADTIVFDKTGTLTRAVPEVAEIVTFDGSDETECLRIAACLEEHYPHSVANAVVEEARRRNVHHEEMHSTVEYIVAHGIASTIEGKKSIIGSAHFVFDDEKVLVPEGEEAKLANLPGEYSHLFLCIDGRLKAAICIFDPLREEAQEVVQRLHELGIRKICMMTGDSFRTAEAVAQKLHLDEFHAEVLPEDKAAFVRSEHAAGRKVIMIGDGINDTPALSEADAGIAISDGAAIAREVADITISSDDLYALVTLRRLSQALMKRIHSNYRFIITFNSALIALGVSGILAPSTSALLHNTSTIVTGLRSMTNLLEDSNSSRGTGPDRIR